MALIIDDHELEITGLSEKELRLEIALMLYQNGKFSIGKASEFARIDKIYFKKELGKRKIAANYDADEFEKDLKYLGL